MRFILFFLLFGSSSILLGQETKETSEEFIPIIIGEKEAFLSTKTGEYVFRSHEKTNPEQLKTTSSGVIYLNSQVHIVKANETLFGIAKKYGVALSQLKKANKLSGKDLRIGQKLTIIKKEKVKSSSPIISYDGEERIIAKLKPNQSPWELNSPQPFSENQENTEQSKEPNIHIVKSGETLFTLAKKYNLSVQELKKLNGLALNNLSIGQKLKIK